MAVLRFLLSVVFAVVLFGLGCNTHFRTVTTPTAAAYFIFPTAYITRIIRGTGPNAQPHNELYAIVCGAGVLARALDRVKAVVTLDTSSHTSLLFKKSYVRVRGTAMVFFSNQRSFDTSRSRRKVGQRVGVTVHAVRPCDKDDDDDDIQSVQLGYHQWWRHTSTKHTIYYDRVFISSFQFQPRHCFMCFTALEKGGHRSLRSKYECTKLRLGST